MSADERARRNPFLVPPAERKAPRSKSERWRVITAVLARPGAWMRMHRGAAPIVGAAHDRSPPRGRPALDARVRLGCLHRRDRDHGGDRQPIRHSPPGVRTQRARGRTPRRAEDGRSLRGEQPTCATGSAARASTPPGATSPCAPDSPRASAIASGDQGRGSRSPVHAVGIRHRLLRPQPDQLKLRGLELHAGALAARANHRKRHNEQLELGQQPPGVW